MVQLRAKLSTKSPKSKNDGFIRVAKNRDFLTILTHRKDCLQYLRSYTNTIESGDKDGFLVVYELNSEIVGSARLDVDKDIGTLTRVVTSADYRNSGVGSALVIYLIDYAQNINVKKIKLRCLINKYSFYERLGFEKIGKSYKDDNNRYYNMQLNLQLLESKGSII
jgi:N-acetylglutamate synthase-like GNAT family acetyltransferase